MNVYFGGTFDPPHLGHHEMLIALASDAWVERVFLVPTSINPLKENKGTGSAIGTDRDRKQWIEIWLDEVRRQLPFHLFEKISLELLEFEQSGQPTFTIDTFTKISEREAKFEWALCIGGDSIKSLPLWKSIEELLGKLHSLWIFPRGQQSDPALEIAESLRPLAQFRIMSERVTDVSSTKIRESVRADDALQKISRLAVLPRIKESLVELVQR